MNPTPFGSESAYNEPTMCTCSRLYEPREWLRTHQRNHLKWYL